MHRGQSPSHSPLQASSLGAASSRLPESPAILAHGGAGARDRQIDLAAVAVTIE